MSLSLEERLRVERHRRFVGRQYELDLFWLAMTAPEPRFCVLHIFGPGGIGKTSLLREFILICKQSGMPVTYLDARNIEASPEGFLNVLRSSMNLTPSDSPFQALASQPGRWVFLIDTYEALVSLDEWLHEAFLPQLPESTFIVLAGRNPPASTRRTDPGWQALLHPLSLRNLSPEQSRIYLTKRAIPLAQHQAVLDFTHGHPLALSLVADIFAQNQDIYFQPQIAPDAVKTLLEKFVEEVPTPAHRIALEACALVRLTTEALLAEMLALEDAHELFEWLRGLSFIQSGRLGLLPHDLAREVLVADLRWRNLDLYAELHCRARTYYTMRMQQASTQEQQQIIFDLSFLHRDNPVVRPCFEWQESRSLLADIMRDTDRPALISMVAKYEGEESARLAAHWLARQPQGVLVFRDGEQLAGFVLMLALHQASPEDLSVDPATQAAWRYLQDHAPLRPNEGATHFRFWMGCDTYQAVSLVQSLIVMNLVRHYLTTSRLAFTFLPCAEPDFWDPMFTYGNLRRISQAEFEVSQRCYGVYGHDWRVVTPMAWLALLAEREIATSAQAATPSQPSQSSEPLVVLSQPEFVEAVQDTLRNFSRPSTLHQSPLLQSRLVVRQVTAKADKVKRVDALQTLVVKAAESLQSSPREAKLYRALDRTYLHPAPTQELAAELLDLPFGTFRRHLKAGIARVVDVLWQQEIS